MTEIEVIHFRRLEFEQSRLANGTNHERTTKKGRISIFRDARTSGIAIPIGLESYDPPDDRFMYVRPRRLDIAARKLNARSDVQERGQNGRFGSSDTNYMRKPG